MHETCPLLDVDLTTPRVKLTKTGKKGIVMNTIRKEYIDVEPQDLHLMHLNLLLKIFHLKRRNKFNIVAVAPIQDAIVFRDQAFKNVSVGLNARVSINKYMFNLKGGKPEPMFVKGKDDGVVIKHIVTMVKKMGGLLKYVSNSINKNPYAHYYYDGTHVTTPLVMGGERVKCNSFNCNTCGTQLVNIHPSYVATHKVVNKTDPEDLCPICFSKFGLINLSSPYSIVNDIEKVISAFFEIGTRLDELLTTNNVCKMKNMSKDKKDERIKQDLAILNRYITNVFNNICKSHALCDNEALIAIDNSLDSVIHTSSLFYVDYSPTVDTIINFMNTYVKSFNGVVNTFNYLDNGIATQYVITYQANVDNKYLKHIVVDNVDVLVMNENCKTYTDLNNISSLSNVDSVYIQNLIYKVSEVVSVYGLSLLKLELTDYEKINTTYADKNMYNLSILLPYPINNNELFTGKTSLFKTKEVTLNAKLLNVLMTKCIGSVPSPSELLKLAQSWIETNNVSKYYGTTRLAMTEMVDDHVYATTLLMLEANAKININEMSTSFFENTPIIGRLIYKNINEVASKFRVKLMDLISNYINPQKTHNMFNIIDNLPNSISNTIASSDIIKLLASYVDKVEIRHAKICKLNKSIIPINLPNKIICIFCNQEKNCCTCNNINKVEYPVETKNDIKIDSNKDKLKININYNTLNSYKNMIPSSTMQLIDNFKVMNTNTRKNCIYMPHLCKNYVHRFTNIECKTFDYCRGINEQPDSCGHTALKNLYGNIRIKDIVLSTGVKTYWSNDELIKTVEDMNLSLAIVIDNHSIIVYSTGSCEDYIPCIFYDSTGRGHYVACTGVMVTDRLPYYVTLNNSVIYDSIELVLFNNYLSSFDIDTDDKLYVQRQQMFLAQCALLHKDNVRDLINSDLEINNRNGKFYFTNNKNICIHDILSGYIHIEIPTNFIPIMCANDALNTINKERLVPPIITLENDYDNLTMDILSYLEAFLYNYRLTIISITENNVFDKCKTSYCTVTNSDNVALISNFDLPLKSLDMVVIKYDNKLYPRKVIKSKNKCFINKVVNIESIDCTIIIPKCSIASLIRRICSILEYGDLKISKPNITAYDLFAGCAKSQMIVDKFVEGDLIICQTSKAMQSLKSKAKRSNKTINVVSTDYLHCMSVIGVNNVYIDEATQLRLIDILPVLSINNVNIYCYGNTDQINVVDMYEYMGNYSPKSLIELSITNKINVESVKCYRIGGELARVLCMHEQIRNKVNQWADHNTEYNKIVLYNIDFNVVNKLIIDQKIECVLTISDRELNEIKKNVKRKGLDFCTVHAFQGDEYGRVLFIQWSIDNVWGLNGSYNYIVSAMTRSKFHLSHIIVNTNFSDNTTWVDTISIVSGISLMSVGKEEEVIYDYFIEKEITWYNLHLINNVDNYVGDTVKRLIGFKHMGGTIEDIEIHDDCTIIIVSIMGYKVRIMLINNDFVIHPETILFVNTREYAKPIFDKISLLESMCLAGIAQKRINNNNADFNDVNEYDQVIIVGLKRLPSTNANYSVFEMDDYLQHVAYCIHLAVRSNMNAFYDLNMNAYYINTGHHCQYSCNITFERGKDIYVEFHSDNKTFSVMKNSEVAYNIVKTIVSMQTREIFTNMNLWKYRTKLKIDRVIDGIRSLIMKIIHSSPRDKYISYENADRSKRTIEHFSLDSDAKLNYYIEPLSLFTYYSYERNTVEIMDIANNFIKSYRLTLQNIISIGSIMVRMFEANSTLTRTTLVCGLQDPNSIGTLTKMREHLDEDDVVGLRYKTAIADAYLIENKENYKRLACDNLLYKFINNEINKYVDNIKVYQTYILNGKCTLDTVINSGLMHSNNNEIVHCHRDLLLCHINGYTKFNYSYNLFDSCYRSKVTDCLTFNSNIVANEVTKFSSKHDLIVGSDIMYLSDIKLIQTLKECNKIFAIIPNSHDEHSIIYNIVNNLDNNFSMCVQIRDSTQLINCGPVLTSLIRQHYFIIDSTNAIKLDVMFSILGVLFVQIKIVNSTFYVNYNTNSSYNRYSRVVMPIYNFTVNKLVFSKCDKIETKEVIIDKILLQKLLARLNLDHSISFRELLDYSRHYASLEFIRGTTHTFKYDSNIGVQLFTVLFAYLNNQYGGMRITRLLNTLNINKGFGKYIDSHIIELLPMINSVADKIYDICKSLFSESLINLFSLSFDREPLVTSNIVNDIKCIYFPFENQFFSDYGSSSSNGDDDNNDNNNSRHNSNYQFNNEEYDINFFDNNDLDDNNNSNNNNTYNNEQSDDKIIPNSNEYYKNKFNNTQLHTIYEQQNSSVDSITNSLSDDVDNNHYYNRSIENVDIGINNSNANISETAIYGTVEIDLFNNNEIINNKENIENNVIVNNVQTDDLTSSNVDDVIVSRIVDYDSYGLGEQTCATKNYQKCNDIDIVDLAKILNKEMDLCEDIKHLIPSYKSSKQCDELYECLVCICDYMVKNKMYFSLICGTALGAIYHGDLIPWDFDIDILICACSYETLYKSKLFTTKYRSMLQISVNYTRKSFANELGLNNYKDKFPCIDFLIGNMCGKCSAIKHPNYTGEYYTIGRIRNKFYPLCVRDNYLYNGVQSKIVACNHTLHDYVYNDADYRDVIIINRKRKDNYCLRQIMSIHNIINNIDNLVLKDKPSYSFDTIYLCIGTDGDKQVYNNVQDYFNDMGYTNSCSFGMNFVKNSYNLKVELNFNDYMLKVQNFLINGDVDNSGSEFLNYNKGMIDVVKNVKLKAKYLISTSWTGLVSICCHYFNIDNVYFISPSPPMTIRSINNGKLMTAEIHFGLTGNEFESQLMMENRLIYHSNIKAKLITQTDENTIHMYNTMLIDSRNGVEADQNHKILNYIPYKLNISLFMNENDNLLSNINKPIELFSMGKYATFIITKALSIVNELHNKDNILIICGSYHLSVNEVYKTTLTADTTYYKLSNNIIYVNRCNHFTLNNIVRFYNHGGAGSLHMCIERNITPYIFAMLGDQIYHSYFVTITNTGVGYIFSNFEKTFIRNNDYLLSNNSITFRGLVKFNSLCYIPIKEGLRDIRKIDNNNAFEIPCTSVYSNKRYLSINKCNKYIVLYDPVGANGCVFKCIKYVYETILNLDSSHIDINSNVLIYNVIAVLLDNLVEFSLHYDNICYCVSEEKNKIVKYCFNIICNKTGLHCTITDHADCKLYINQSVENRVLDVDFKQAINSRVNKNFNAGNIDSLIVAIINNESNSLLKTQKERKNFNHYRAFQDRCEFYVGNAIINKLYPSNKEYIFISDCYIKPGTCIIITRNLCVIGTVINGDSTYVISNLPMINHNCICFNYNYDPFNYINKSIKYNNNNTTYVIGNTDNFSKSNSTIKYNFTLKLTKNNTLIFNNFLNKDHHNRIINYDLIKEATWLTSDIRNIDEYKNELINTHNFKMNRVIVYNNKIMYAYECYPSRLKDLLTILKIRISSELFIYNDLLISNEIIDTKKPNISELIINETFNIKEENITYSKQHDIDDLDEVKHMLHPAAYASYKKYLTEFKIKRYIVIKPYMQVINYSKLSNNNYIKVDQKFYNFLNHTESELKFRGGSDSKQIVKFGKDDYEMYINYNKKIINNVSSNSLKLNDFGFSNVTSIDNYKYENSYLQFEYDTLNDYDEIQYNNNNINNFYNVMMGNDIDITGREIIPNVNTPYTKWDYHGKIVSTTTYGYNLNNYKCKWIIPRIKNSTLNSAMDRIGNVVKYRKHKLDLNEQFKKFKKLYINEDKYNLIKNSNNFNIEFNYKETLDWLNTHPDTDIKTQDVREILNDCFSANQFNFVKIHAKMENLYKSNLSIYEEVDARPILALEYCVSAILCPVFQIIKNRLKSVFKDYVIYADGLSYEELRDKVTKINNVKWLFENDLKKQDKQTDEHLIDFENMVYEYFGLNKQLVELWKSWSKKWRFASSNFKGKGFMMRKSGDPTTALANLITNLQVLMLVVELNYSIIKILAILGDDSTIGSSNILNIRNLGYKIKVFHNMQSEYKISTKVAEFLRLIIYIKNGKLDICPNIVRDMFKYSMCKGFNYDKILQDKPVRDASYLCKLASNVNYKDIKSVAIFKEFKPVSWYDGYEAVNANAMFNNCQTSDIIYCLGVIKSMMNSLPEKITTIKHDI